MQPVTLDFVIREIDHLCKDKATGEDGISCKILKMSKHAIAQSLTDIINMSLIRGVDTSCMEAGTGSANI